MALTQVYTAVSNDVITSARWNNEFGNIYNNGTDVAFPVTKVVSFAGFTITLDSAGATTLSTSAAKGFILTTGVKAGVPGTGAATGQAVDIASFTFTDTDTAGSGTAAEFSAVSIGTPTLAATNTSVTTTDAATLYIQNAPAPGTNETITNPWAIWVDNGAVRFDGGITASSSLHVGSLLFGKPISGLIQSNAAGDPTNDITISAGETVSDDATLASRRLMVLASAITKRLDAAWAVGSDQGGLDSGSIGDSDYYIWLIQRADTGVVDVLFSLSSTAPTMPTSYAFKRLIGWFKRVSASILTFTVHEISGGGIELNWGVPTLEVNLVNTLTTSRRTDAIKVPLNFSVQGHVRITTDDAAAHLELFNSTFESDTAPSATAPNLTTTNLGAGVLAPVTLWIRTSATGTIAARATVATIDDYQVLTIGFMWGRR